MLRKEDTDAGRTAGRRALTRTRRLRADGEHLRRLRQDVLEDVGPAGRADGPRDRGLGGDATRLHPVVAANYLGRKPTLAFANPVRFYLRLKTSSYRAKNIILLEGVPLPTSLVKSAFSYSWAELLVRPVP